MSVSMVMYMVRGMVMYMAISDEGDGKVSMVYQ